MIECDKVGFSISFPSVFHVQKKPTSYKPWGNNFIVLFIFFPIHSYIWLEFLSIVFATE